MTQVICYLNCYVEKESTVTINARRGWKRQQRVGIWRETFAQGLRIMFHMAKLYSILIGLQDDYMQSSRYFTPSQKDEKGTHTFICCQNESSFNLRNNQPVRVNGITWLRDGSKKLEQSISIFLPKSYSNGWSEDTLWREIWSVPGRGDHRVMTKIHGRERLRVVMERQSERYSRDEETHREG